MVLLATATVPSPPLIDLSLGSLPVYLLLFVFAWSSVLFARRTVRDRLPRRHLPSLSISLLALVGSVLYALLSEGLHVFSSAFSWTFLAGCLLFSFFVQIFKRSLGTIAGLSLAALIVMVILFIRSLTAFTGRTLIARIQADTANGEMMSLLVEPQPGSIPGIERPFTLSLPGERFGLIVYQIIFDDTAVFLGAKTRYAWLGITSFGTNFTQKAVRLFPATSSRKELFESLEKRELSLPFVRSVQADIATKLAIAGKKYSVWIENDGGVTINAAHD